MRIDLYRPWSLHELAQQLGASPPLGDVQLTGVGIDSRELGRGDVFVALEGERVDGNRFVDEVLEKGGAALTRRADLVGRPGVLVVADPLVALQRWAAARRGELAAQVIGITASVGKSTIKEFTASALASSRPTWATPGNLNGQIGLPLVLLSCPETAARLVLEMGISERGEMDRLVALARPEAAILGKMAAVHTERLGDLEGVAAEKGKLLRSLPRGAPAVVLTEVRGPSRRLVEDLRTGGIRVVAAGLAPPDLDLPACWIESWEREELAGQRLRTASTIGSLDQLTLEIAAPGRHNALNALAALVLGVLLGDSPERLIEGLATARPLAMRSEVRRFRLAGGGTVFVYLDAYNASPASLEAAADTLGRLARSRRILAVLGDMLELGPDAADVHRNCGRRLAAGPFDIVVTVGELAAHLARGFRDARGDAARAVSFASHPDAAEYVGEILRPGDWLLVKGSRGARMEEVVRDLTQSGRWAELSGDAPCSSSASATEVGVPEDSR